MAETMFVQLRVDKELVKSFDKLVRRRGATRSAYIKSLMRYFLALPENEQYKIIEEANSRSPAELHTCLSP